ncbi:MAG: endonuclease/exonuclease/phosphatase family protein [Woeseiaceae bacterium]
MTLFARNKLLAVLTALAVLGGCTTAAPDSAERKDAMLGITVMTFNVENLFDNIDDPGKDDKAYLPLQSKQSKQHIDACNEISVPRWRDECLYLDWNEATLQHKLTALADTIRQVNGGRGADIIALQEVENVNVLERLRNEFLGDLGYLPSILVEGADRRGIDVAFLSRIPLSGTPVLHPLSLAAFPERQRDTRGVLQADFLLPNGAVLTGFSVHFPAPYHPTGMRIAAYDHLNGLLRALPDNHHAFAAGDFNTTSREDSEQNMLERLARPNWTVAHDIGCDSCKGTQYYARDDSWSFLDMILFAAARGENTTARLRAESVQIANRNPAQVSGSGTPERFNAARQIGVSDHWPMIATIEVTIKQ